MRKGICGRADLLDAIRLSREAGLNLLPETARIIGFKQVSLKPKEPTKGSEPASRSETIPDLPQSDPVPSGEPQSLAPTPFWMPSEYRLGEDREGKSYRSSSSTRPRGGMEGTPGAKALVSSAHFQIVALEEGQANRRSTSGNDAAGRARRGRPTQSGRDPELCAAHASPRLGRLHTGHSRSQSPSRSLLGGSVTGPALVAAPLPAWIVPVGDQTRWRCACVFSPP